MFLGQYIFVVQFFGKPITAKPVLAINNTVDNTVPQKTIEKLPATKEGTVKGEEIFVAVKNEPKPIVPKPQVIPKPQAIPKPQEEIILPSFSESIINQVNNYRIENNISILKINPLLQKAAQQKAEDMAKYGYFSHTSPQGISPWYWFDNVGYNLLYAGENIAVKFSDPEKLMNAWINSPSHKENIINYKYDETGIGIAFGIYKDKETMFVVQLFGKQQ